MDKIRFTCRARFDRQPNSFPYPDLRGVVFVLGLFIAIAVNLQASGPNFVSDSDLTEAPVIVIARWKKAAGFTHDASTTLEVLRTIKGSVPPGTHPLHLGREINWKPDGTCLNSDTTTLILGDVADITSTNIWFLRTERYWDLIPWRTHLVIDNYRAIQPLDLELFYAALLLPDPDRAVAGLLTRTDSTVNDRALRYFSRKVLPSPHGPEFQDAPSVSPETLDRTLNVKAKAVAKLLGNHALINQRPMAIAVYGELTGKAGSPLIAGLLADKDSSVRGMAAVVLVRNQDAQSIPEIIRAVNGITDGELACNIIEGIKKWKEIRLTPALITFLQNGDSAGFAGDQLNIPAIQARQALQEITGYAFPYDVAVSKAAWDQASGITNIEERTKLLSLLAPNDPMPLYAEIVKNNRAVLFRIINTSKRSVIVAKRPSFRLQNDEGGGGMLGMDGQRISGKQDFETLQPGGIIEFEVQLENRFLLANPASRTLKIGYDNNGAAYNINAWIGILPVTFGAEWTEDQKVETIQETWPNGKIKVTGQTVNGQKRGEWIYYNEEGDATHRATYFPR